MLTPADLKLGEPLALEDFNWTRTWIRPASAAYGTRCRVLGKTRTPDEPDGEEIATVEGELKNAGRSRKNLGGRFCASSTIQRGRICWVSVRSRMRALSCGARQNRSGADRLNWSGQVIRFGADSGAELSATVRSTVDGSGESSLRRVRFLPEKPISYRAYPDIYSLIAPAALRGAFT